MVLSLAKRAEYGFRRWLPHQGGSGGVDLNESMLGRSTSGFSTGYITTLYGVVFDVGFVPGGWGGGSVGLRRVQYRIAINTILLRKWAPRKADSRLQENRILEKNISVV